MPASTGRRAATLALAVVLLTGGAMRALRCDFGLPYPAYWDEPLVVESGLRILGGGGWEPYTFRYGTPAIYLSATVSALAYLFDAVNGSAASLADWTERQPTITDTLSAATQAPRAWLWSRLVFAVLSLFTVWGAYAMARALGLGRAASLMAAAVVAISPLHVMQSSTATVDPLGLAFATWSLVCLVQRYPDRLTPRSVSASALLAAIAAATKFSFLPVAAIVIAGTLASSGTLRARWRLTLRAAAVLAAAFVIASPFSLFSVDAYLAGIGAELRHYAVIGHDGQQQSAWWDAFVRIGRAAGFRGVPGWTLLALSVLGAAALLFTGVRAARSRFVLLLVSSVAWSLAIGRMAVFFDRSALPLLPVMAVCAAGGVHLLATRWPRRLGPAAGAVVAAAACATVIAPVGLRQFDEAVLQFRFVGNREQLVERIVSVATPGQTIAVSRQLPLYTGDLRRHRLNVLEVDPVTDPCWFVREPFDFFVSSSDAGPGWPAPVFFIGGNLTSIGHPFLNPEVRLYPRRAAGPCDVEVPVWYTPATQNTGTGVSSAALRLGLGYYELEYDGWMTFALKGNAGEQTVIEVDADAHRVADGRTDDRPVLAARVVDARGEDVCWDILALGDRAATIMYCRLQGQPPWILALSYPASVEWGIRSPWVVQLHGVRAAVASQASAAQAPDREP